MLRQDDTSKVTALVYQELWLDAYPRVYMKLRKSCPGGGW